MPPIPEQRTQASQWLGRATSPLVSLGNSLRESRVFQPSGICFHAEASPKHGLPSHFRNLAHRLSGDTLVRLSGGLWQEEHRLLPDVLNCSIRFKAWPPPGGADRGRPGFGPPQHPRALGAGHRQPQDQSARLPVK